MRLFTILCLLFPVVLFAQKHPDKMPRDSASYYSKYILDRYKQTVDSFKASNDIKQAQDRLTYLSAHSDNYSSVNFYTDVAGADFDHLNSTLTAEGFSPLKKAVVRLGYGFTAKYKSLVFDFNLGTVGLNNKSKNGDETVKATFSNLLELNFGYDVIKSPAVNLYPYAGLSLRNMTIEYNKPAATSTQYTDITNIVQSNRSVSEMTGGLGYQAGIGIEFVLATDKEKTNGTIFFLKGGTNGAFGNPTYKISGLKYDPQIKYGQWIVTAGFKFFGRKDKAPYEYDDKQPMH